MSIVVTTPGWSVPEIPGLTDPGIENTLRVIDPRDNTLKILPLAQQLQVAPYLVDLSIVGAFPPKRVDGDFTRENHEWLSALVQSDWLGGGQMNEAQESSTLSRYEGIAGIETRFPHQATLLPKVNVVTSAGDAGPCTVLGDLKTAYDKPVSLWGAWGTKLKNLGSSYPGSWSLGATPVGVGAVFRGTQSRKALFIPCGTNGYHRFDPDSTGSELSALFTTAKPLSFVEFERNLYCLESDGTIKVNPTGASADWTTVLRLDGDGDAKSLLLFYNQAGEPNIFAVTSRMVYAVDPGAQAAYPTDAEFAPHPSAALAAAKWNNQLWFSHGVDVGRYDGATISYVGLARDTGLPPEFRGKIVSMAAGWNDLFVLVEGAQSAAGSSGRLEIDADGDLLVGATTGKSALMRLNRLGGWHSVWVDTLGGTALTNCYVSATEGRYRLYWGWKNQFNYIDLPPDFDNPAVNPQSSFEPYGELLSSWFDMDYTAGEMILVAFQVGHKKCDDEARIALDYQIDNDDDSNTWRPLGVIRGPGDANDMTKFLINTRNYKLPNEKAWFDGRFFHRVRYRVRMWGTAAKSPVLKWVSILYMKKMGTVKAITATIKCDAPAGTLDYGMSNEARQKFIDDLIELAFVPVCFVGNDWRMVKFVGANGPSATGQRFAGNRTVTMLEAFAI